MGFSDFQITRLVTNAVVMILTIILNLPTASEKPRNNSGSKQIDTLAAEYPAQTNYLYLTYGGTSSDVHYLVTIVQWLFLVRELIALDLPLSSTGVE